MSLINQMLEDLERRRQGAPAQRLPEQLRSMPAATRRPVWRWQWLAGGLLAALLVGVLARPPWHGKAVGKSAAPATPVGHAAAPARVAVAMPPAPPAAPVAVLSPGPMPAPAPQIPAALSAPTQAAAGPVREVPPVPAHASRLPALETAKRIEHQSTKISQAPAMRPAPRHAARPPHPVDQAAPPEAVQAAPERGRQEETEPQVSATRPTASPMKQVSPKQQADAYYMHGVDLLQAGHLNDAIDALKQALAYDSGHLRARQMLVSLALQEKNYARAEAILANGLSLHPGQLSFVMMLARLQVERQATAEALATLNRASAAGANNAEYLAFRATLLQSLGRHAEAIRAYRQALVLAPRTSAWLMGLGISLQANRQLDEARQAYLAARQTGELSSDLNAFIDQKLRQLPD